MITAIRLLTVVLVGLVVAACSEPVDPTGGKQLGVIAFSSDPIVVQAPDTVQAGVAFQVEVRTYGNGCVSENGTEVHIEGSTVNVWPYDHHSGATWCTDILNVFDHQATVTLGELGSFEIRFHGRAVPGDSAVEIVRSVVVQ